MTDEQIKHLARLAEIELSNEDVERMKNEFNRLLEFVGRLQWINTEWIDMMYTPIESIKLDYTRKTCTQIHKEDLLSNSPHGVDNDSIIIKSSTVEH